MSNAHHDVWALSGALTQWIYGPKGELQGLLLESEGTTAQFVLSPHDAHAVSGFALGQHVTLQGVHQAESPKGEAEHDVYHFVKVSDDGQPASKAASTAAPKPGRVVRFNFAKHGERNGVVLDNGNFVHTKPHGMALLELKIGDRVDAIGETRPLFDGKGVVIDAHEVNGIALYETA